MAKEKQKGGMFSSGEPVKPKIKVNSSRQGIKKVRDKALGEKTITYPYKYQVKKSDLEVYDMLSKLAKAKGLKGNKAEEAIMKVFYGIAKTASTERQRTLTRAEGITKRQSNKRKNTNLLP
jgi:hypothetical protein